MFFFGKKKVNLPAFTVGVFGKLPFYKDFLYSSFGSEFAELKAFFDSGMDQLHRSGKKRPFVEPARNFYISMDGYQNDLVGSVWDSHDGLRAFPFILAAPFPRKIRKEEFAMFWTVLSQFWGYFGELYGELKGMKNTSDFYQLVKGSRHQLNSVPPQSWKDTHSESALQASLQLNDGFLASVALTEKDTAWEEQFLKALHLNANPAMILWPRDSWQTLPRVTGYMGTMGFDELCISFFPPETAFSEVEDSTNEEVETVSAAEPEETVENTEPDPKEKSRVINQEKDTLEFLPPKELLESAKPSPPSTDKEESP